jgi:hypothetical protein
MAALETPRDHLLRTIRDQRDHYQRQAESLQGRHAELTQVWGTRYSYDATVIAWSLEFVAIANAVLDAYEQQERFDELHPTIEALRA